MSERVEQYRSFVEQCEPNSDGYLFDQPRTRFWPEPGDELVALPVVLRQKGKGAELVSHAPLEISGIEFGRIKSAFAALRDGPCAYGRLLMVLGPELESFVQQTFGKVLFAPGAVAALEVELPGLELVRFPGSPYELVRSYWRNMVAVRRCIEQTELTDAAELRALLLELHQLALLGSSDDGARSSFYLPASALGRKRPTPGSFYEMPSALERRGGEVILTSGARVSVPLLGGQHYWQLLAESVSDEQALAAERTVKVDGLPLGQLLQARAEDESQSRPWFVPPRPLLDGHFETLSSDLMRARAAVAAGDQAGALASLGAFHYRFVRTHPLPSANQSLSMSFVNVALRQLLGIGIPHLLLDQLALRFDLAPFQQLFARAARAWSAPWPNPAERLRRLIRMRTDLNAFVSELSATASLLEARALLLDNPEAARLALLAP